MMTATMTAEQERRSVEAARQAIARLEASDPVQAYYGSHWRAGRAVCEACGAWHDHGSDCEACGSPEHSAGLDVLVATVLATVVAAA